MSAMPYYTQPYLEDTLMAIFIGALIFAGIIALVFYIFQAIGLYNMSKRRGYKNAWLAFVPFVNAYVLGGIADNVNYCCGKRSNFRVILLIVQIVYGIAATIAVIMMMDKFAQFLFLAQIGDDSEIMHYVMQMMASSLLLSLFSIVLIVVQSIVLYKIYQDYAGRNAVIFLVLSILFGIAPFFLFGLRNQPAVSLYRGQPPVQPVYPNPSGPVPPQPPVA